MSLSFELSIEVSEKYDFNKESLPRIEQNTWVKINGHSYISFKMIR